MQTSEQFDIEMLKDDVEFLFDALRVAWILISVLSGLVTFLFLS